MMDLIKKISKNSHLELV